MPPSGISPNTKPTTPAVVAATGRTSLGNWICLISFSWLTTELAASAMLRGEPLPGQDRRQDEERIVGRLDVEDQRHEDDVDTHLEQRIQDPPEVAEERVRALLLDVGLDEVADQASSGADVLDGFADEPQGTRPGRGVTERGGGLTRGGHRREG